MRNQIVLYGLGGAYDNYAVIKYHVIYPEEVSVREIQYQARRLRDCCPNIQVVYIVDNRHCLRRDYMDAVRSNSIEGWAIFKDILSREGMRFVYKT